MEQELQELRAVIRVLAEQLRVQNETMAAKDAQIAALTEQVVKLTARIEELTHKKNSNNSSKPPSEERLENGNLFSQRKPETRNGLGNFGSCCRECVTRRTSC